MNKKQKKKLNKRLHTDVLVTKKNRQKKNG